MTKSDQERDRQHGWDKTYVVYSKRLDMLGIHKGPKFLSFDNELLGYWPHDIDHECLTSLLCDENFREDYIYVGEL